GNCHGSSSLHTVQDGQQETYCQPGVFQGDDAHMSKTPCGEIMRLTDVNINKLHQPWRSFAAIINKFLSGKSTGYDSLRTMDMIIDQQLALDEALAFLVITDVPEIYMQEFWATATVHHHSIRFKMDNKKRIVNLEYFKEMMHICQRLPGQTFDDLPFEEEILAFL
nr:hypothetical protein [Tanacetum cinerariifolium]